MGADLGFTHTELGTGTGSVQEIIASPKLIDGIDSYVIQPANANPFDGPVRDAVLGSVADLRADQLRAPTDLGFVDDLAIRLTIFRSPEVGFVIPSIRGQLATDGASHNIGISDLAWKRS